MGYLILGIITLAAILIFGGYIVLSVINAAMWMDDSMRWGGRDEAMQIFMITSMNAVIPLFLRR